VLWDFQDLLARRLLLWSALSVTGGLLFLALGDTFWRGFGLQAVVWGVIDAAIAYFGQRSAARQRTASRGDGKAIGRAGANLRRLLWINTGLDVLYVAGGVLLVYTLGRTDLFAAGNGWGVILQGGFLLLFDLLHALAVPNGAPDTTVHQAFSAAFAGPEHRSFRLEGGTQTALLIHGFAGTPDELRGLAQSLHRAGWTVSVPLLPGFGADIATLPEREHAEWQEAVTAAARELAGDGRGPDLLVGYSLGAALSVAAANTLQPAGLVLLAPFHWPEPWWLRPGEFFVRPFLPPGFRPLRKSDLSEPRLAAGIRGFMPDVDLEDPQVQAAMRDFRVPLSLIDQVRAAGRRMLAAAPQVMAPALVIQGSRDSVARPAGARKLLARLPRGTRYVEVDGEHDLMRPGNPAWPDVERALLDFAAELTGEEADPNAQLTHRT
jgi:pimeloyl-ACP methyl ester carboxylesterase